MKTQDQLKKEIMGRVYIGYALRRVWSFTTLRLAVILGSVIGIVSSVSIRHVIQNMPSPTDVGAFYNFFSFAILNTQFIVQLSLIGVVFVGFATIIQMTRSSNIPERAYIYKQGL